LGSATEGQQAGEQGENEKRKSFQHIEYQNDQPSAISFPLDHTPKSEVSMQNNVTRRIQRFFTTSRTLSFDGRSVKSRHEALLRPLFADCCTLIDKF
jgi:hypothetical protein